MNVDESCIKVPDISNGKGINKTLKIELPANDFYFNFMTYSEEKRLKIMQLGEKCYESMIDIDREWGANEHETEVTELIKENKNGIKKEKEKNKKSKEKIKELEGEIIVICEEYELNLDRIRKEQKAEAKTLYETKIEMLNDELEESKKIVLEKDKENFNMIEDKMENLRDKHKEEVEELRTNKNKELEDLRATADKKIEEIRDKYNTYASDQKVSANKGLTGEDQVEKWLTDLFPTGEIEITAKQGKRADMILTIKDKYLLFEVKTDKRNVQKVGVEKFEKEMRTLDQVHGGVFISMNRGISCREDWEVRMYNGKPAIFLCCVKENPNGIKGAVNFILQLINTEMNVENKQATITAINAYKKNLLSNTTKMKNQMNDNNKMMQEHLDRINSDIEAFVLLMLPGKAISSQDLTEESKFLPI